MVRVREWLLCDGGPAIVTDSYREYVKLVADVGLSDALIDCARKARWRNAVNSTSSPRKIAEILPCDQMLSATAKLRRLIRGLRIKPPYGMNPYDLRTAPVRDRSDAEAADAVDATRDDRGSVCTGAPMRRFIAWRPATARPYRVSKLPQFCSGLAGDGAPGHRRQRRHLVVDVQLGAARVAAQRGRTTAHRAGSVNEPDTVERSARSSNRAHRQPASGTSLHHRVLSRHRGLQFCELE